MDLREQIALMALNGTYSVAEIAELFDDVLGLCREAGLRWRWLAMLTPSDQ